MEQRNGSQEGEESVRIHVGGLGPSVISSDLMQTFSAIATVSSVDIIRTKGRNFAYITFLSPSPQAIKRIFTLVSLCPSYSLFLSVSCLKEYCKSRRKSHIVFPMNFRKAKLPIFLKL